MEQKFNLAHIRNRGIAGDVTEGVLMRLGEITYFKPKAVFILIGINDLFSIHHTEDAKRNLTYDLIVPSVEYIAGNILNITKQLRQKSPEIKVFVRTVLPTRRDYLKEDILLLNLKIKDNKEEGGYQVIDLYKAFVDKHGELKKELTPDGVHLNEQGYKRWVTFEKPILQSL